MMIVGSPYRLMMAAVLLSAALAGCENFENPLAWKSSAIADDLIGNWIVVEGPDTGARARVSRTNDGALRFELTYPENTESAVESDRYKHRAYFLADVLGSGLVNVLQLRMDSYAEYDRDGEQYWSYSQGYLFQRVIVTPGERFDVHRLDLDALGEVAEEERAGSDQIDVEAFTECLSEDVAGSLWMRFWGSTNSRLGKDLRIEVQEALKMDQEDLSEIERETARLTELKVDPYAELAHIRNCVAQRLPSESLEQIFLHHTDRVFAGGIDRYVRE